MFADTYSLCGIIPARHPIYGGIKSSENHSSGNVVHQRSIIYDCNESILRRYVFNALADHELLSGKLVRKSEFALESDPEPEKTFTVQIVGDDIDYRFGNRVMFANETDVSTLLNFLVKEVGNERMYCIRETLSGAPSEIHQTGIKWVAKWKKDEDWPL